LFAHKHTLGLFKKSINYFQLVSEQVTLVF
jgi:hypothetical protein